MELTPSDEELEATYEEISIAMKYWKKHFFHFYNIYVATGVDLVNLEEFDNMDDAASFAMYDVDTYLRMTIASFCWRRMRTHNGNTCLMAKRLPRFIPFDEATNKHTWDRAQLYQEDANAQLINQL